jgi:hypothetical protein
LQKHAPSNAYGQTIGQKMKEAIFASYLALTPDAGDVVPSTGGVRKVRWSRPGAGKRGGVRVVYFNRLVDGEIWLLLIYSKSVRDNVPAELLKQLKQEMNDAHD